MKILITGSSGMLGSALCRELSAKHEVAGLDIRRNQKPEYPPTLKLRRAGRNQINFVEADITQRDETIEKIVSQKPEIIIHSAAYTDVDGCERDRQKAELINAVGTKNVAQACKKCGCLLVYLSTDYVFDGKKDGPYNEQDVPAPLNVYGRTKLEGEQDVQRSLERFFIIRSSWLFGGGGKNFVDSIIRRASKQETIRVVKDQFGSPTHTGHLTEAIEKIISIIAKGIKEKNLFGVYHITNSGSCSWFEFARKIVEFKGLKNRVEAISSAEINRAAKRPANSRLDNSRFINLTGFTLVPWETALRQYLEEVRR